MKEMGVSQANFDALQVKQAILFDFCSSIDYTSLIQLKKTYLLTVLPPGSMKRLTKQKDTFFFLLPFTTSEDNAIKKRGASRIDSYSIFQE